MRSFVTGSQVYGSPDRDSDIDLVVLVTRQDLQLLRKLADSEDKEKGASSDAGPCRPDYLSASLRFGLLNLLCVTDPVAFAVWQEGTIQLEKLTPPAIDRQTAIDYFRRLRGHRGLYNEPPQPLDGA